MKLRLHAIIATTAVAALMGACANSDNPLTTASISQPQTTAATVDPTCVALSNQINNLRAEGSVERLEKAAEGKSSSVNVKRTSLAKQAELNRVYAEFQTKCGPKLPHATVASNVAKPTSSRPATAPNN